MSSLNLNQPPDAPRTPSKPVRILIVDGDPIDLARYVRMLDGAGCTIIACESHLTALECMETMWLDGIVVDQGADRYAWRSVVDRATRPGLRIPVLVMTECRDIVCQLEALQLGAVAYREKPLTAEDVIRTFEGADLGISASLWMDITLAPKGPAVSSRR